MWATVHVLYSTQLHTYSMLLLTLIWKQSYVPTPNIICVHIILGTAVYKGTHNLNFTDTNTKQPRTVLRDGKYCPDTQTPSLKVRKRFKKIYLSWYPRRVLERKNNVTFYGKLNWRAVYSDHNPFFMMVL